MDGHFSPNHVYFLFRTEQVPFFYGMRCVPGVEYAVERAQIIAQDNNFSKRNLFS